MFSCSSFAIIIERRWLLSLTFGNVKCGPSDYNDRTANISPKNKTVGDIQGKEFHSIFNELKPLCNSLHPNRLPQKQKRVWKRRFWIQTTQKRDIAFGFWIARREVVISEEGEETKNGGSLSSFAGVAVVSGEVQGMKNRGSINHVQGQDQQQQLKGVFLFESWVLVWRKSDVCDEFWVLFSEPSIMCSAYWSWDVSWRCNVSFTYRRFIFQIGSWTLFHLLQKERNRRRWWQKHAIEGLFKISGISERSKLLMQNLCLTSLAQLQEVSRHSKGLNHRQRLIPR